MIPDCHTATHSSSKPPLPNNLLRLKHERPGRADKTARWSSPRSEGVGVGEVGGARRRTGDGDLESGRVAGGGGVGVWG